MQSIEKGAKELGCNSALIITFDEEENIKSKSVEIKVVPLWKWLLGL